MKTTQYKSNGFVFFSSSSLPISPKLQSLQRALTANDTYSSRSLVNGWICGFGKVPSTRIELRALKPLRVKLQPNFEKYQCQKKVSSIFCSSIFVWWKTPTNNIFWKPTESSLWFKKVHPESHTHFSGLSCSGTNSFSVGSQGHQSQQIHPWKLTNVP